MNSELNALADKLNELIALVQHVRADNQVVRQRLASALNENKQLHDKIFQTTTRLETLLEKIPAEAHE